ncbi:MAG: hypothetical protein RLZZ519_3466 [Bacteroidota bacterium]|jgi:hypothetical protein
MKIEELDAIKRHVAGATVLHTSPFESLESFDNGFELSKEFIVKWSIPFYACIGRTDAEWRNQLLSIKAEITPSIIRESLGDLNWRTRQTGAFFAAITDQTEFIDVIGTHLLKSEVCYAGGVYAMVFASFNTQRCIDYLDVYLDYYLTKPDLWFDQNDVMAALKYLDQVNSTNLLERHLPKWDAFLENKPHWDREISTVRLEENLSFISSVREAKVT